MLSEQMGVLTLEMEMELAKKLAHDLLKSHDGKVRTALKCLELCDYVGTPSWPIVSRARRILEGMV